MKTLTDDYEQYNSEYLRTKNKHPEKKTCQIELAEAVEDYTVTF